MIRRTGRLLAAAGAGVALALTVSSPAWAEVGHGPFNEMPGRPLGLGAALLLFVVVPLVILAVTAGAVWLPGVVRAERYRPQRGWSAAPLWFGGPPDVAVGADEAGTSDGLFRGGAHGEW